MKKPIILYIVILIIVVLVVKMPKQSVTDITCTDTDGGRNVMVKGTATITANGKDIINGTDYCSDVRTVFEYSCDANNNMDGNQIACPNNYICSNNDGVCIIGTSQPCSTQCTTCQMMAETAANFQCSSYEKYNCYLYLKDNYPLEYAKWIPQTSTCGTINEACAVKATLVLNSIIAYSENPSPQTRDSALTSIGAWALTC